MLRKKVFVLCFIVLSIACCFSMPKKQMSNRITTFEHQYDLEQADIKTKAIEFLSIHFIQGTCNIQTDYDNRLTGSFSFIIDKYSTYCTTNFIMTFYNGKLQYKLIVQDVYNTIPPINHYSEPVWGNFEEQINIAIRDLDEEFKQYITGK